MRIAIQHIEFAHQLSAKLISLLFENMSARVNDTDFAQIVSEIVGGQIVNDCGWNGVQYGNGYLRTIVLYNPQPFNVKHLQVTSCLPLLDAIAIKSIFSKDPNNLGGEILGVWNRCVTGIRERFETANMLILIKGDTLSTISLLMQEPLVFRPDEYEWEWDQDDLLVGYIKGTDVEKFTWQPHGSQFTIITNVPDNRLKLRIRRPPLLDREEVLTQLRFDPSWIEIVD